MFDYFILINDKGEYFCLDDHFTGFYDSIVFATIFTNELYDRFNNRFDLFLCKKIYIDFIYSL